MQLSITAFIISLLLACGPKHTEKQPDCHEQCITMKKPQLEISLNTDVILVEQQYEMKITSKQPIESMSISGSNMNMGTLPLFLTLISNNNNSYIYQSSFILGLCSQPEMTWVFKVERSNDSNSTNTVNTIAEFDFVSYWQRPKS